jgi:hypothetical protein
MKIEFTRAEIERIILDHIKNEVAPYTRFVHPVANEWRLPDTITVEAKSAAQ